MPASFNIEFWTKTALSMLGTFALLYALAKVSK